MKALLPIVTMSTMAAMMSLATPQDAERAEVLGVALEWWVAERRDADGWKVDRILTASTGGCTPGSDRVGPMLFPLVLVTSGASSGAVARWETDRAPSITSLLIEAMLEDERRLGSGRHSRDFPRAEDDLGEGPVEAVEAAARRAGVDTATAFPVRPSCTGYLAPPGARDITGCPDGHETVMAFGCPEKLGPKAWRLPLISINYSPYGRAVHSIDAYLVREDGSWTVDRTITRVVFD